MSIRVKDIRVDLGGNSILAGIDLTLQQGEVLGLIGPNGSGKSTLLRAILGLQPATHGEVAVRDKPLAEYGRGELARLLAYLPQDHTIHWSLTAASVVALGREPHLGMLQNMSSADRAIVTAVMEQTDIARFAERSVRSLSAGERARVLLARAMAVEAPYLLADEPTAALDPRHQIAVMRQLADLAQGGTGVIVVVHDLALAAQFCNRLCLLDAGSVASLGSPAEVLSDQNIGEVYGVAAKRLRVGNHELVIPVGLAT